MTFERNWNMTNNIIDNLLFVERGGMDDVVPIGWPNSPLCNREDCDEFLVNGYKRVVAFEAECFVNLRRCEINERVKAHESVNPYGPLKGAMNHEVGKGVYLYMA